MKYRLTLADKAGLRRICDLLKRHAEIMEILNADSKRSSEGGAAMHYEVAIELKSKWS